jgi:hypothetical protein
VLVQLAQQDILNISSSPPPDQGTMSEVVPGWTPLSVRLAAYGESLALERRLKKEEKRGVVGAGKMEVLDAEVDQLELPSPTREVYDSGVSKGSSRGSSRVRQGWRGLDRKLSLEQKSKQSGSA